MSPRPLLTSAAIAAALLLPGCSALAEDPADDGRVTVAAGFYPLAWVAEQVAGEHAEVVSLTRPGQEAHDAGMSIEKTADLAEADLVVLSESLQPEVAASARQNARGSLLEVADVVDLLPAAEHGHGDHDHDEDGHEEDWHDEDGHDEDGHEGHDHGDEDPHFWLDPLRMADLGDAVADGLADVDPEHATDYETAAARLRDELTTLDGEYAAGLADCERSTVVVSHDAFGYLARYGLTFEPIAGLSPDAEPTPADLQHLQELIGTDGITTVFSETLGTSALAESLARDAGVTTDTLDPVEGPAAAGEESDYLSLMRDNLAALVRANGC
ncbi:metal ABC transporter substrate-binding protein [Nocardioides solisilvae]|uniref:metal ABC transporter substrate-binding protein n=1 Tax=Nocardioides solisilvae TaxID=1542435 RepID=UPI0013A55EF0|nr:metal ABC transporter substrate-binding protein [Nocardioides solisilvae]